MSGSIFTAPLTFNGLTASTPLQLDASNVVTASNINLNSQVSGVLPTSLGGTGSSTITDGAIMVSSGGTIVEGTSSTVPTFQSEALTDIKNQIAFGKANIVTLNISEPIAPRLYTIDDPGKDANVVMNIAGAMTIENDAAVGQFLVASSTNTCQWQTLNESVVTATVTTINANFTTLDTIAPSNNSAGCAEWFVTGRNQTNGNILSMRFFVTYRVITSNAAVVATALTTNINQDSGLGTTIQATQSGGNVLLQVRGPNAFTYHWKSQRSIYFDVQ